jgi:hypothetical protein
MRITCTSTPEGNIYRFYRTELDVYVTLKPIVPFLLASQAEMVVGRVDDSSLLLSVGPVRGDAEATLIGLLGPYLSARCPAVA